MKPAKHLKYFRDHQFEWKGRTRAPKYTKKRKNLKALLNRYVNPSLNEQLNTEVLVLFRNCMTRSYIFYCF